MHFIKTALTSLLVLSTITSAAPFQGSIARRQSPVSGCINGQVKLFTPQLHNIYIYKSTAPFPSTSNTLNIMNGSTSKSVQDQVVRWTNIPSTATSCTIGWAMASQRSFSVYNNGLVRFRQMSGFPAAGQNVTVDTIVPFDIEGGKGGSMDFTYWPETAGPRGSIGGPVDCGSEVVVKLWKDMQYGGAGSVTLEQTGENGLYLAYNC